MRIAQAVLLIGSAKPAGGSTSEVLGRYLLSGLERGGVHTTALTVNRSAARRDDPRLANALVNADLFIVATPVYVDSLPYLVTRTFEWLASTRARTRPSRRCAFVALVNCGFPESEQCRTALDIARAFAHRASFDWAGGLALGEGGAIDGRSLEGLGGLTRNARAALDAAAAALVDGAPVPQDVVARFGRPLMPTSLYTFMGNVGWKRRARKNGVHLSAGLSPP
jgi:multimeric flavodoxin WrbA